MSAASSQNDLYSFDPAASRWLPLAAAGAPSGRVRMGFAAASDGRLYVFGGYNDYAGEASRRVASIRVPKTRRQREDLRCRFRSLRAPRSDLRCAASCRGRFPYPDLSKFGPSIVGCDLDGRRG